MTDSEKIRTLYRDSMQRVTCPEALQERILQNMTEKEVVPKKNKGNLAAAVIVLLLTAGILMSNTGVANAFSDIVRKGVGYFVKDINGVKDVGVLIHMSLRNQELETAEHDISEWQSTYPEFYAELEANEMLDIYLPHYKMGEYAWEDTVDYYGKPLKEGEAISGAAFTKEDSSYYLSIARMSEDTRYISQGRYAERYELEVNGILYEVTRVSEDYTYQESKKVNEERSKNSGMKIETKEEDFEKRKARPVSVTTWVNGLYYSYALSADIDVEAFLESIY